MPNTQDSQYNLVKHWGIAKEAEHLNASSQRIPIDSTLGAGYFERYDFPNASLSRLQCQFKQTQQLTNENCATTYALHFTLQGSSTVHLTYPIYANSSACTNPSANKIANSQANRFNASETIALIAPTVWLVKGNLGSYSTTIHAHEEIKAFYIELDETFIATLIHQLQHQHDYHNLVLAKLIATQSYLSLPIAFNTHTDTLIKKAWQLFNTPSPTNEMSFMTLQGKTLLFTSNLLMHSFHKLIADNSPGHSLDDSGLHGSSKAHPNHAYQAKFLLDEYYHQNWTIRDLAKKSGTNECYLKLQFKQLTQMTIGDYRTQKRLQIAEQLLNQGVNLSYIAYKTGFNSTDYFVKVFKKHYGCHPKDIKSN